MTGLANLFIIIKEDADKIQAHYYMDGENAFSNAKVYVVFNEGSVNEIIKIYDATLTKQGNMVNITSIEFND